MTDSTVFGQLVTILCYCNSDFFLLCLVRYKKIQFISVVCRLLCANVKSLTLSLSPQWPLNEKLLLGSPGAVFSPG